MVECFCWFGFDWFTCRLRLVAFCFWFRAGLCGYLMFVLIVRLALWVLVYGVCFMVLILFACYV